MSTSGLTSQSAQGGRFLADTIGKKCDGKHPWNKRPCQSSPSSCQVRSCYVKFKPFWVLKHNPRANACPGHEVTGGGVPQVLLGLQLEERELEEHGGGKYRPHTH